MSPSQQIKVQSQFHAEVWNIVSEGTASLVCYSGICNWGGEKFFQSVKDSVKHLLWRSYKNKRGRLNLRLYTFLFNKNCSIILITKVESSLWCSKCKVNSSAHHFKRIYIDSHCIRFSPCSPLPCTSSFWLARSLNWWSKHLSFKSNKF